MNACTRSPSRSFTAITFDVGGTLITPKPSVGHIYASVAAHHGFPSLSPERINRRFATAWRALKRFRHTRAQWARLVDASFGGDVPVLPSRTFFPEIYNRFTEPSAWRVYSDVWPTLRALSARGYRLGIISNWDERLMPLLHALKLAGYFEQIIVSCDVRSTKPSRRIFGLAAARFKLSPVEMLHIGDSRGHDYAGALRAGFQARLLNRGARQPGPAEIPSLRSLLQL